MAGCNSKDNMKKSFFKQIYSKELGQKYPSEIKKSAVRHIASQLQQSPHSILSLYSKEVNCLDVDKAGEYLLSCSSDCTMNIHKLEDYNDCKAISTWTPRSIRGGHTHSIETVQWYPHDTGMFLSSGMDRLLKVWDTETQMVVETFRFPTKVYHHNMFTSPTKFAAMAAVATADPTVIIVDLRTGSFSHQLNGHCMSIRCCQWNPAGGFMLATGSADTTVRLWDIRTTKSCLATMKSYDPITREEDPSSHNGYVIDLAFNPSGKYIVSMGSYLRYDGVHRYTDLRLWETTIPKDSRVDYKQIEKERPRSLKGIRLCIDGYGNDNLLFVPCESEVRVYEMLTGKLTNVLSGHINDVNCVRFNLRKMEAYSAGVDRNILLWQRLTTPETSFPRKQRPKRRVLEWDSSDE